VRETGRANRVAVLSRDKTDVSSQKPHASTACADSNFCG